MARKRTFSAPSQTPGIRLHAYLSQCGVCSRREGEEYIANGRIRVNGKMVKTPGTKILPGIDKVEVDKIPINEKVEIVSYLLYKPDGVVSTVKDPEGRQTVVRLVPQYPRVYPAGRLDYHTEGLLILTNDGDLAQYLTHPSNNVEKTYWVKAEKLLSNEQIERIERGVVLDGKKTKGMTLAYLEPAPKTHWYEVKVAEGRYREIRRVFEAVGVDVRRLIRVAIGPLQIEGLRPGKWRTLTRKDLNDLGYLK